MEPHKQRCDRFSIFFKGKLIFFYTVHFIWLKYRNSCFKKCILDFLKLNSHCAFFILLVALYNYHSKKKLAKLNLSYKKKLIIFLRTNIIHIDQVKLYIL